MAKKPKPAPAPAPEPPKPPKRPKTAQNPKGAGRPAYVPDEKTRTIVKVMTAGGIQQSFIAEAIGIDEKLLRQHYRKELDTGLAEANAQVVSRLFKQTETNIRAVEFWLTNRDKKNWAHTQRVAVEQDTAKNLGDRLARAQAKISGKGKAKG